MEKEIVKAVEVVRVSSDKQRIIGESHENQDEVIKNRVIQIEAQINKTIKVVKSFKFSESASGEYDMQPIVEAIDYCKNSKEEIQYLFIKSIDRFTRAGATIYDLLKSQLTRYGVQLVDAYGVISTQKINTLGHLGLGYKWSIYSPSTQTELLEAERAKSDVRDILTRMIGAEINYVRQGYSVRQSPPGFRNIKIETQNGKRTVREADPVESPWFIKMFQLSARGDLSVESIVSEVNKMGYLSRSYKLRDPSDKRKIIGVKGKKPLTVKQLQRYIKNPIYAGINNEKWTESQPVRTYNPGLVDIDTFNKANKGKVFIEDNNGVIKVHKSELFEWQKIKNKDNPLFPYKKFVLCPFCQKPLLGSAPKNKMGNHIPRYHCSRKHKYWSINKKIFDETIENFTKSLKFSKDFRDKFRKIVLEEWEKRRVVASKDSISLEEYVLRLKNERRLVVEKIKQVTSESVIKSLEEDVEMVDRKIAGAIQTRDKKEDEEIDIQTVINHCNFYMEHLKELLLGGTNPMINAQMFGLVFENVPTYEELKNGTPQLAPIFELNEAFQTSKKQLVTPQRVELCLMP